jgi:hypothetical protein
MHHGLPIIRIDTPSDQSLPGRGFYQLEEDALFVQIGLFTSEYRFFSYLESDTVRLDLDREGRVLFIEVSLPRRQWETDDDLCWPPTASSADIRWLNFRATVPEPGLLTNESRTLLRMEFRPVDSPRRYLLADNVAIEVAADNTLSAIWINDIEDDVAGRGIADFRNIARKRFEELERSSISD